MPISGRLFTEAQAILLLPVLLLPLTVHAASGGAPSPLVKKLDPTVYSVPKTYPHPSHALDGILFERATHIPQEWQGQALPSGAVAKTQSQR